MSDFEPSLPHQDRSNSHESDSTSNLFDQIKEETIASFGTVSPMTQEELNEIFTSAAINPTQFMSKMQSALLVLATEGDYEQAIRTLNVVANAKHAVALNFSSIASLKESSEGDEYKSIRELDDSKKSDPDEDSVPNKLEVLLMKLYRQTNVADISMSYAAGIIMESASGHPEVDLAKLLNEMMPYDAWKQLPSLLKRLVKDGQIADAYRAVDRYIPQIDERDEIEHREDKAKIIRRSILLPQIRVLIKNHELDKIRELLSADTVDKAGIDDKSAFVLDEIIPLMGNEDRAVELATQWGIDETVVRDKFKGEEDW